MAIPSRQIGWGTESNLLWQILKQLNKLTSVLFGLKEAATPNYKVYTALLTQSGGDNPATTNSGELTIGGTYTIDDNSGGLDVTNLGSPNNNIGTSFVVIDSTGIGIPNNWGTGVLSYNTGAPVATVLENTIGNIWFNYEDIGIYGCQSNDLFTTSKTFISATPTSDTSTVSIVITNQFESVTYISPLNNSLGAFDNGLYNSPIEIRVYN